MAMVSVLSPAKINLMLRVLNRRPDGYHELQSCFELLPWGDSITFQSRSAAQPAVNISGFTDLADKDNLIYQAAELLKPVVQQPSIVDIAVDKQIPGGAGLGGGSSNAAVTLVTLNKLWACQLDVSALLNMALKLGADVPFFVSGQSALVSGIGEHIEPMKFYRGKLLLLFPELAISTRSVFQHPDLCRNQSPLPRKQLMNRDFWINDCFPIVLKDYPEISQLFKQLSPIMPLRLSGTGSTLFVLCDNQEQADRRQKIASAYCRTRLLEI